MPDYGLLGGIGQGLQAGFQSYMAERKHQEDTRSNALAKALQAKLGGVTLNAAGTGYDDTPETQLKDKVNMAKLQGEAENYDKASPYAGLVRNTLKGQLHSTHPEYSDEQLNQEVPEGLLPAQYEKAAGLIKPELSGYYNMLGRKEQAAASERNAKMRNDTSLQGLGIRREGLDLRRSNAAQGINKEVMHDPLVRQTDLQTAAIQKGLSRLDSKEALTPQMLSDVEIDLAKAISGGGNAAQGTIHRVEMDTAKKKLVNLQQYLTGVPTDGATPEQRQYLKQVFTEMLSLANKIRSGRIKSLTGQASQAYGNEGAFGNVINNLNQGASGEGLVPEPQLSPEDQQAISWAKSNPKSPKAAEILKLHGM